MSARVQQVAAPVVAPVPAEFFRPRQLRARLAWIALLTVLVSATGWMTCRMYANVVQTIGKDTVPSIVAAEKIRTTIADAHAQLIDAFLADSDKERLDSMSAFEASIAQADGYLTDASQNITYGDEERVPILEVLGGLSAYDRLAGAAFALRQSGTSAASLASADALVRDKILPAASALDTANFAHMNQAYTTGQSTARLWLLCFVGTGLILGVILLETQVRLKLEFRRIVNPAIAIGFLTLLAGVGLYAVKADRVVADLHTAKVDAFDSVHALAKALALAYQANAQESVYLLEHGQAQAQGLESSRFIATAAQLATPQLLALGPRLKVSDLATLPAHGGLLGDELANITFDGEDAAARATLAAWTEYAKIDAQIRTLESTNRHAEAVALCRGTQPGQSDGAFNVFTANLQRTSVINQVEFDAAIDRASRDVRWLWMLLIPIGLGPILGSAVGLQQRINEFRE